MLERDRRYVGYFFDPNKLGEVIGQGLRMRVYPLKDDIQPDGVIHSIGQLTLVPDVFTQDIVVKVPRTEFVFPPDFIFPASDVATKLGVLRLGREYFPDFIVNPTYMVVLGQRYVLFQRKLEDFQDIDPQNIKRAQKPIKDIVNTFSRLIRDGMYLDLLGSTGINACLKRAPRMTNMVIERVGNQEFVRMPDISLLQIGKVAKERQHLFPKRRRLAAGFIYLLSRGLIRHYFGIDLQTGAVNEPGT